MAKKIYKKGTTIWLACRTHDAQSLEYEEYVVEADSTEDELLKIAEEFAHNSKELEWWIDTKEPSEDF